jgi:hypothetical protein
MCFTILKPAFNNMFVIKMSKMKHSSTYYLFLPMVGTPVEAVPESAAPVMAAPVSAAPVGAAPVMAAPVAAAPMTVAPVAAAPMDVPCTTFKFDHL